MSKFLELNLLDFDLGSNFMKIKTLQVNTCICCLNRTGEFAFIYNCVHADFLQKILIEQDKYQEFLICSACHIFAKKVHDYQKQVEENLRIIEEELEELEVNERRNQSRLTMKQLPYIQIPPIKIKLEKDFVENLEENEVFSHINASDTAENVNKIETSKDNQNETMRLTTNQLQGHITVINTPTNKKPSYFFTHNQSLVRCLMKNQNKSNLKNSSLHDIKNRTSTPRKNENQPAKKMIANQDEDLTQTSSATNQKQAYVEVDIKLEHDFDVDVKTEPDWCCERQETSVLENNDIEAKEVIEQPKKKSKKKYAYNVMDADIRRIILTEEEMLAEREKMREKEIFKACRFKCEDCIISFRSKEKMNVHIQKIHKDKFGDPQSRVCQICKAATKIDYFKTHQLRHYRRFECIECGARGAHRQFIKDHIVRVHNRDNTTAYQCKRCDFATKVYTTYKYHLEKHKTRVTCDECDGTYRDRYSLLLHKSSVHETHVENPYKCSRCPKSFVYKSRLERHEQNVHDLWEGRTAYCEPCGIQFKSVKRLRSHLISNSAHKGETNRYECDSCGSRYLTKRRLEDHIKFVHLKTEDHKCGVCKKNFLNKQNLEAHIKFKHKTVKPPHDKICRYCGKRFSRKDNLVAHIRKHAGERPLRCRRCKATFAHLGSLYSHTKWMHKDGNTEKTPIQRDRKTRK